LIVPGPNVLVLLTLLSAVDLLGHGLFFVATGSLGGTLCHDQGSVCVCVPLGELALIEIQLRKVMLLLD
jgi:hypothetical protein